MKHLLTTAVCLCTVVLMAFSFKSNYFIRYDEMENKKVSSSDTYTASVIECALMCKSPSCSVFSHNEGTSTCALYRSLCQLDANVVSAEEGNKFYRLSTAMKHSPDTPPVKDGVINIEEVINSSRNDGWIHIFTLRDSSGVHPYIYWLNGSTEGAVNTSGMYRSDLIGNWSDNNFKLAKIEMVSTTDRVYVTLNVEGKDVNSWVDSERIVDSSYVDMPPSSSYDDFYLERGTVSKFFCLYRYFGATCDTSTGWMSTMFTGTSVCQIAVMQKPKPYMVYAKCNVYASWKNMYEHDFAEYLNVYAKK